MSFSSFGCLSHIKQKPGNYWMSGNQILKKEHKSNDPYQIGQSSNKNISHPEFLNKRNVVPFLFLLFSSGSFKQKFNTFKSASQSEDS